MRQTGHYEVFGQIQHFIPDPLPPHPPINFTAEMATLYGQAMLELGKINEMAYRVPDIKRFIKAYVYKEALLSSAIEGIHTTLLDIFTQPLLESKPNKNTQLVMNYTQALEIALRMIKKKGLPIATRVILAAHKELMQLGEGDKANPGHFRKQSVRVGQLIPPPAPQVPELMAQLEHYINNDQTQSALIKAGLAHVQFETIHPFLDGNGRIGRLLIMLILIENELLSAPIIYPSYYFKKQQLEYYQCLDRVRTHGDFEGWIVFYLTAMRDSSIDAYRRAQEIELLEHEIRQRIIGQKRSIKIQESRRAALSILFSYPIISINELAVQLEISYNTANQIISDFIQAGILVEENKQKRGKLFRFAQYLDVLEKEYA